MNASYHYLGFLAYLRLSGEPESEDEASVKGPLGHLASAKLARTHLKMDDIHAFQRIDRGMKLKSL